MAKLSSLKPRLTSLLPIGCYETRQEAERARMAAREREVESRKWYRSPEWQRLRRQVFARDHYVCRQTGVLLIGRGQAPNSPVADHIVPHRGDPKLFWDPDNLQTVSKAWHDSVKQAQERRTS